MPQHSFAEVFVRYVWPLILPLLFSACPRAIGGASSAQPPAFRFDAPQKDEGAVLAQVGGTAITVAQIQKLINKQSAYVRAQYEKDSARTGRSGGAPATVSSSWGWICIA